METLILNSESKKDVKLLMDIAKKLGMDLRIAERRDLILAEARLLNQSVGSNSISPTEIVETCNSVRKERHEQTR